MFQIAPCPDAVHKDCRHGAHVPFERFPALSAQDRNHSLTHESSDDLVVAHQLLGQPRVIEHMKTADQLEWVENV